MKEKDTVLDLFNAKTLEGLKREEDIEEDALEASDFKEVLHRVWIKIDMLLEMKAQATTTTQPSASIDSSYSTKKPKLPEYHGDQAAWKSFWDTFESAVDKNPNLSEIDKFNH